MKMNSGCFDEQGTRRRLNHGELVVL